MDDLFGFALEVKESSFSEVFVSGGNAYWDARGILEAGRSLGVVANEMPPATMQLVKSYVSQGGACFCDSGAFGAFKRQSVVDFDEILSIYEFLLDGIPEDKCKHLFLVMPDALGDQDASLALLDRYRSRIDGFIAKGADCIIPIHRGRLPVHEVGNVLVAMFGPKVRFGLPSAAVALSDEELARFRHDRFHILGKATMDAKLRRRAYTLLAANPGANISCDANLIRTRMGEVTKEHRNLIANSGEAFGQVFDDTELVFEVIHGRRWMKRSEIARLATMYGQGDSVSVQRWVNAHRDDGLESLIEEFDPEGAMLYQLLPMMFDDTARAALSARLRSQAVATVLAA